MSWNTYALCKNTTNTPNNSHPSATAARSRVVPVLAKITHVGQFMLLTRILQRPVPVKLSSTCLSSSRPRACRVPVHVPVEFPSTCLSSYRSRVCRFIVPVPFELSPPCLSSSRPRVCRVPVHVPVELSPPCLSSNSHRACPVPVTVSLPSIPFCSLTLSRCLVSVIQQFQNSICVWQPRKWTRCTYDQLRARRLFGPGTSS